MIDGRTRRCRDSTQKIKQNHLERFPYLVGLSPHRRSELKPTNITKSMFEYSKKSTCGNEKCENQVHRQHSTTQITPLQVLVLQARGGEIHLESITGKRSPDLGAAAGS